MNSATKILNLTNQIMEMTGSTTHFIELMSGKELHVKVLKQQCTEAGILERSVVLFQYPFKPIVYSESFLLLSALSMEEQDMLLNKSIPIGKIFSSKVEDPAIEKRNVVTETDIRLDIKAHLALDNEKILKKTYDYWDKTRYLGVINEFFSEKSLQRIFE